MAKLSKLDAYRIKVLVAEYLATLAQKDELEFQQYGGKDKNEHEETSYEDAEKELREFLWFVMESAYREG